eukprot:7728894-Ditylum_brightwellii.AAC.1
MAPAQPNFVSVDFGSAYSSASFFSNDLPKAGCVPIHTIIDKWYTQPYTIGGTGVDYMESPGTNS